MAIPVKTTSGYTPRPVPTDVNQLPQFLTTELQNISNAENSISSFFGLAKQFVAPVKPFDGQFVYADGTHWNPGSGQGLYYYKIIPPASSGSWIHIA